MNRPFPPLTDRVRKIVQLAHREAQRARCEYVAPEHLLFGLVIEGSGVAAHVLKNRGVDRSKICPEADPLMPSAIRLITTGRLPMTLEAKEVLELAIQEAQDLHHAYVGSEHLLLGLLRQEKSVAAAALKSHGVTYETARAEALSVVGVPVCCDEPSPTRKRSMAMRRVRLWWVVAWGVVVLIVANCLYCLEASRVHCWMCEETGSVKYCRTARGESTQEEERYVASAMEQYLQDVSSGDAKHRWVHVSSWGYNVFGKGVSHGSSSRPTHALSEWIASPEFHALPDEHKRMIHDVLVRTRTWTDAEKRRLYEKLGMLKGKDLRDFIESRWKETGQKKRK